MKIEETIVQVHIISGTKNDNRDFLKDVQRIIYNLIQKLRAKRPDIAQNIKREIRENADLKAFDQTERWIEKEIVSSDSPSNRVLNKLFKTFPYMQKTVARYVYLALSKDIEQDKIYSKLSAKSIKVILAEQSDSLYREWTGRFPVKKTAKGKKILRACPAFVEKVFGSKKIDVKLLFNTMDFVESFLEDLTKDPELLNKINKADMAIHKKKSVITKEIVIKNLKIKLRSKLKKFSGPGWNFLRGVFAENLQAEKLLINEVYRQILNHGIAQKNGWNVPEYYKRNFIIDFAKNMHAKLVVEKPGFYAEQVKKYKIRQSKRGLRAAGALVRKKLLAPNVRANAAAMELPLTRKIRDFAKGCGKAIKGCGKLIIRFLR